MTPEADVTVIGEFTSSDHNHLSKTLRYFIEELQTIPMQEKKSLIIEGQWQSEQLVVLFQSGPALICFKSLC